MKNQSSKLKGESKQILSNLISQFQETHLTKSSIKPFPPTNQPSPRSRRRSSMNLPLLPPWCKVFSFLSCSPFQYTRLVTLCFFSLIQSWAEYTYHGENDGLFYVEKSRLNLESIVAKIKVKRKRIQIPLILLFFFKD